MMRTDLYKINLKSLREGEHQFDYFLDKAYFEAIEGSFILDGEVDAEVRVLKRGDLYQVNILVDGYAVVSCDRCLGDLEEDVYSERDLVVKFGSEYREESDEVLVIPAQEGVLDLHWMLYEDVVLSLPMQRMHPDGECDSEMTARYASMSSTDVAAETDGVERDDDGVDLRWAALKKLKES
ncbi:MAG: DUF177 domain-containing protein [Porphyromonas sp.]|nr:DUF177 domain-containing protein [Porphyromonas sp.]